MLLLRMYQQGCNRTSRHDDNEMVRWAWLSFRTLGVSHIYKWLKYFSHLKMFLIRNQNFTSFESTDFNWKTNFRGISFYSTTQTLDAVYIIGGYYTKYIVAEFKNDQWRRLANLNRGRSHHGSITIGGQTMTIGGYFDNQTLVKLFSGKWMTKNLFKSLFSPLVTEVWEFENGNSKIIQPTLPDDHYLAGIALYVVENDFCKKWFSI